MIISVSSVSLCLEVHNTTILLIGQSARPGTTKKSAVPERLEQIV